MPAKGQQMPLEQREKIRNALMGNKNSVGEKNGRWLGGISRPYIQRLLKDQNECEWCGIQISGYHKHIHHLDGNPRNNALTNVAVLCAKDHKRFDLMRVQGVKQILVDGVLTLDLTMKGDTKEEVETRAAEMTEIVKKYSTVVKQ